MPDALEIVALPPDLHYVDDSQPGLRRKVWPGHFAYFDTDGQRIKDPAEIDALRRAGASMRW